LVAIKHRSRRNQWRLLHRCSRERQERREHQERRERQERREHQERRERQERLAHLENLHRLRKKIRHGISGYILAKRIYPESMEDG
jgi:hypothetical protein